MKSLVTAALLLTAGSLAAGSNTCQQPTDSEMKASATVDFDSDAHAVFVLIDNNTFTSPEGVHALKVLGKPGEVVGHLRHVINDEGADSSGKELAYYLLVRMKAGELPGGVEQFLTGLTSDNWKIRDTSALGLSVVKDDQARAARALVAQLAVETEGHVTGRLLESLSG